MIIHSRFMLDLRGIYFADSGDEESELPSHWSGINFRGVSSIVVGNLGATLDTTPGSAPNPQDSSAAPQDSTDGECESEWEDEVPKYCDDPFTTGMKDSGSSNVAQGATQDSETAGVSLGTSYSVNPFNAGDSPDRNTSYRAVPRVVLPSNRRRNAYSMCCMYNERNVASMCHTCACACKLPLMRTDELTPELPVATFKKALALASMVYDNDDNNALDKTLSSISGTRQSENTQVRDSLSPKSAHRLPCALECPQRLCRPFPDRANSRPRILRASPGACSLSGTIPRRC